MTTIAARPGAVRALRVPEPVRERAAQIARERGCDRAADLIEAGHQFPRLPSCRKPVEQRAWAAVTAALVERDDAEVACA